MISPQILLDVSSLCITHDQCNKWLYVDWKGPQSTESVRWGCGQLQTFLRSTGCHKVLNDNTNATGDWEKAARWIGQEFLPVLASAGLHYLAWVHSPNYLSRRAMEITLSFVTTPVVVSFADMAGAYAWLRSKAGQQVIQLHH